MRSGNPGRNQVVQNSFGALGDSVHGSEWHEVPRRKHNNRADQAPQNPRKPTKSNCANWSQLQIELVAQIFSHLSPTCSRQFLSLIRLTCKSWGPALVFLDFGPITLSTKSAAFVKYIKKSQHLRDLKIHLRDLPYTYPLLNQISATITHLTISLEEYRPDSFSYSFIQKKKNAVKAPLLSAIDLKPRWNYYRRRHCGTGWNGSYYFVDQSTLSKIGLNSEDPEILNKISDIILDKIGIATWAEFGGNTILSIPKTVIYIFVDSNHKAELLQNRFYRLPFTIIPTEPPHTSFSINELFETFIYGEWPSLHSIRILCDYGLAFSPEVKNFLFKRKITLNALSDHYPSEFIGKIHSLILDTPQNIPSEAIKQLHSLEFLENPASDTEFGKFTSLRYLSCPSIKRDRVIDMRNCPNLQELILVQGTFGIFEFVSLRFFQRTSLS